MDYISLVNNYLQRIGSNWKLFSSEKIFQLNNAKEFEVYIDYKNITFRGCGKNKKTALQEVAFLFLNKFYTEIHTSTISRFPLSY